MLVELSNLQTDSIWIDVNKIRNILVHRESPSITFYATAGGAAAPPPAIWTKSGVTLVPALVNGPRVWLGSVISRLIKESLSFVIEYF